MNSSILNSRRNFLKKVGAGMAYLSLASCERPVEKIIPHVIQPEVALPGEALHYATSLFDGLYYESVIAKVVDSRPIKIEPNQLMPNTLGTSASAQATVLDLYDDLRLKHPTQNGKEKSIEHIISITNEALSLAAKNEKPIILVTKSIISPSSQLVIQQFLQHFPSAKHLMIDPISLSAVRKAYETAFHCSALPAYKLNKAKCIVAFNADFLSAYLNPTELNSQYAEWNEKKIKHPKAYVHYQFESALSLTGANACKRTCIKPSEEGTILQAICQKLENKPTNKPMVLPPSFNEGMLNQVTKSLLQNKGQSVIISGTNDKHIQLLVCKLNQLLQNYSRTIDIDCQSLLFNGNEEVFSNTLAKTATTQGCVFITIDIDIHHYYPNNEALHRIYNGSNTTLSFSYYPDETAVNSDMVIPLCHDLESWGDFNLKDNIVGLGQPMIQPLFKSYQYQNILLSLIGNKTSFSELIKQAFFKESDFETLSAEQMDYEWYKALQVGFYQSRETKLEDLPYHTMMVDEHLNGYEFQNNKGIELLLVSDPILRAGEQCNNPWLFELPHPITTSTWGNYAQVSPQLAKKHKLSNGSTIRIKERNIPIIIVPGIAKKMIVLSLGYGRILDGQKLLPKTINPFEFISDNNSHRNYSVQLPSIEPSSEIKEIALTQITTSTEGRDIFPSIEEQKHNNHQALNLYARKESVGHHWIMVVDLNQCTGCNTCVISCQAENNIPVVGPEEVMRNRAMHWINVHRYFSSQENDFKMIKMPVMCQHCDNAPCENVCPVAATNHSVEGVNQMVYNRCIGTRYCNNNCPYKVRTFNWSDYMGNDSWKNNTKDYAGMTTPLRRMVLNPDVTVRTRGVIEKCSFCIQRIQKGKLIAKAERRTLEDDDVIPACASACPSGAISFGDYNNKKSHIHERLANRHQYTLLKELNTKPSVIYLS